jgi:hypothetical protein
MVGYVIIIFIIVLQYLYLYNIHYNLQDIATTNTVVSPMGWMDGWMDDFVLL